MKVASGQGHLQRMTPCSSLSPGATLVIQDVSPLVVRTTARVHVQCVRPGYSVSAVHSDVMSGGVVVAACSCSGGIWEVV